MTEYHNIEPVYDKNSRVLILGSFPSVKSREQQFFYGHKRNRFWKVISDITNEGEPESIAEKKALLFRKRIALWDVIESCKIEGSSDSTIKDVKPNDLRRILNEAAIRKIYCNGAKAYELYRRYIEKDINIKAIKLPSTSPANAAWNLERLEEEWKKILCSIV